MSVWGFRAPDILFGRGASREAAPRILAFGCRVLVIHGRDPARAADLLAALAGAGATVTALPCPAEPTLSMIEDAVAAARSAAPDVVVGLGGGAVIDMAKAVAALLPSREVAAHLEGVGEGRPLDAPPLPIVAIPTTAGTGAEATRNAVIGVPDRGVKVSLRDAGMVPRLAVVDPALTDGCPWPVTLASGLDAVTQVIEPYLSCRATPLTDALCAPAIGQGLAALARLAEGEDAAARDAMARVSLTGGLALANAGLGAVHGFAGVLGGRTGAPHGEICAALLPHVLRANAAAAPGPRHDEIHRAIAAALRCTDADALDRLHGWSRDHGIRGLAEMGLREGDIPSVAAASAGTSSMTANPVPLPARTLEAILHAAL